MVKESFHTVRYPHPEKRNMFGLVSKAWPPPTIEQCPEDPRFQPKVVLKRLRLNKLGLIKDTTVANAPYAIKHRQVTCQGIVIVLAAQF
jgi:hypothetical protein